jgi:hypothetical protein
MIVCLRLPPVATTTIRRHLAWRHKRTRRHLAWRHKRTRRHLAWRHKWRSRIRGIRANVDALLQFCSVATIDLFLVYEAYFPLFVLLRTPPVAISEAQLFSVHLSRYVSVPTHVDVLCRMYPRYLAPTPCLPRHLACPATGLESFLFSRWILVCHISVL